MSAAVTRTLKITYAGLLCGGTSDYLIHGKWSMSKTYGKASISFQVLVQNDSASTFQTNCAALEAAYRTPRGTLTVESESQTLLSYTPSSNTGFHSEPSITKAGDPRADTGRSRLYNCSVTFDLPADLSGVSGRAYATTNIDYDASQRRRITITGRYTALGSNGSLAQYNSAGPTYCASVLSSVASGGTFDLVDEQKIPEDQDKWCDFSRTYLEVLYGTASATLSHASIRASNVTFQRSRVAPGDSPGKNVKRLETITARVDCSIDNTVTTDIETLWTGTIRPYLLTKIKSTFSVTTIADVVEDGQYDHTSNRLSASVTCSCVVAGATTFEYRSTVKITTDTGELLQPAYGGSRYSKYKFDGIAERYRETTELETRYGLWTVNADGQSFSSSGGGGGSAGGGAPSAGGSGSGGTPSNQKGFAIKSVGAAPAPSGGASAASGGGGSGGGTSSGTSGYVVVSRVLAATPLTLGLVEQFNMTLLATVTTEAYYEEPGNGGTTAGGKVVTSPTGGPVEGGTPVGSITPGAR
jgi:hypothetical protein